MIQQGSEISMQISAIQNLRMVNYYQLFSDKGPVDGILAYYEGGAINLCSVDEHYQMLFDKIMRVYSEESKYARIFADEATKKVLKKATVESSREFERRLVEFEEVKTPIFLPKAFSHYVVLPVAKYVVEKLYGNEDAMNFMGFENNWFGKGVMFGDSHGESQRFPFQIVQDDDDTYFVMIRNVLRAGNLLTMEINIDKDGFAATFQEELYGYEGSIFLRVTEDRAVITMNVQSGGKTIVTYETDCKCLQGATLGKTATILSLGATAQEEAEALGAVSGGKEERDSADAAQASKAVADEVPSNDASRWRCFVLPWGDKIFQTIGGDIDAQVLTVDRPDIKLSRGFVTRNIGQKNGEVFPYGCFAFELYERDTASEVRLLDMTYPRSSLYQEAFVGKVYRKRGSK